MEPPSSVLLILLKLPHDVGADVAACTDCMLSKGPKRISQLWRHHQQLQWQLLLVQIVSMEDDMTMPEGWGSHTPPAASPWTDASIYELHIRDFRYHHAAWPML